MVTWAEVEVEEATLTVVTVEEVERRGKVPMGSSSRSGNEAHSTHLTQRPVGSLVQRNGSTVVQLEHLGESV